jgi:hypothetical protein
MKFVVKEYLSSGLVSFPAGAASLDGVLFGKLLFDLSRERFGEDSSRTGIPEAAAYGMMRFDIGDLSREIATCVPIALVKQFGTRHLQCTACFDATMSTTTAASRLPASHAVDLYFCRFRPLTRA